MRDRNRERERDRDRDTERQRDREIERERETDRDRDRDRDREIFYILTPQALSEVVAPKAQVPGYFCRCQVYPFSLCEGLK